MHPQLSALHWIRSALMIRSSQRLVEVERALEATRRYIVVKVPSSVDFKVLEPWVLSAEILFSGWDC